MNAPIIELQSVVRDFGKVRALDRVTFTVSPGIVFGFLGPNGAGKTTVIRILLGLVRPTEGRAMVFGLEPTQHGEEVRSRTGALLEHNGLYERLSPLQNLDFFGRAYRMERSTRRARAEELLTRFGLWDRRN